MCVIRKLKSNSYVQYSFHAAAMPTVLLGFAAHTTELYSDNGTMNERNAVILGCCDSRRCIAYKFVFVFHQELTKCPCRFVCYCLCDA